MNTLLRIAALTSMAFSIQAALAADSPKLAKGLLVDPAGRTLYTFDNDRYGRSACSGGCAVAWPPALATGATAGNSDFSITAREDGADQWTFQGKPLSFAGDAKAGDVNGDELGGVWHAIRGAPRQANQSDRVSPYGH